MKTDLSVLNKVSTYLYMQFMEPLGIADSSVDAAWDYLNERWRPQVIELVRSLAPRMIRFGGCFSSYYHWEEAVGPMEKRVPILNQEWDTIYSNHVGTRELCDFCEQIGGAEPLIVVNMESDGRMRWAYPRRGVDRFGTAEEAARWVAYCNDPDDRLRISHGRKEPYHVNYWEIGNETSYDKSGYGLKDAAKATKEFAKRMKEIDPNIYLTAWGDDGWAPYMCEEAGEYIDAVVFHHHFYSKLPDQPLYGHEYRKNIENTWHHMLSATESVTERIERRRAEVKPYGKRIGITEGHFKLSGRNRCELLSCWLAGAAYAKCFNDIMRASDIVDIATMSDFFGNRWLVNSIIIPTPVRADTKPYLLPVGQVMRLFGNHVGTEQVALDVPESLDAVATRTDDTLFIHIVNLSLSASVPLRVSIGGKEIADMTVYEIAPDDPTKEITDMEPNLFDPIQREIKDGSYYVKPLAVCAVEIPLK